MNKLYNGPTWHNNQEPALNETNLNILGQAVDDIDDRVIAIAGTVMETVPQVQEDLAEAQELLEDVEAINSHPPIIGQNGNWWTWDTSTNAYVDSGKDASVTVSVNPNTETLPAGSNAYVRNVGTSTDPVLLFGIPKGDKGETGGATPGSDISGTVVDTITASTAEYPEIAASDTMKVITGKIKKFLDDLKTKKADKVTSATNGHLAGLDSNGNLTDSGKSSSAVIPSGGTTGQVLKKSSGTDYAVEWGTVSSGGHTILNGSGSAMTQRSKLQFEGMYVTDDSTNDKTKVSIPQFTQAEWDDLSSAQKAAYNGCQVIIKDDYGYASELLKDTGALLVKDNSHYDASNTRYYISNTESTGKNIQYLINRYKYLVLYLFTGGSESALRLTSNLIYDLDLYNNYTYINLETYFSNGEGFSWNVCGYGQYYRASNGNAVTEVAISSTKDNTNSYMRLVVKGILRR